MAIVSNGRMRRTPLLIDDTMHDRGGHAPVGAAPASACARVVVANTKESNKRHAKHLVRAGSVHLSG